MDMNTLILKVHAIIALLSVVIAYTFLYAKHLAPAIL